MIKILLFLISSFYAIVGYGQQRIDQNSIGVIKIDTVINGSGFVCQLSNIVVTCAHVIKANKPIYYQASGSEKQFPLKLVYVDNNFDLAILISVNPISNNPIQIETEDCVTGDKISYCGYDTRFNEILWFDSQIEEVSYSRINGQTVTPTYYFKGEAIPGYSGGPVLNESGKLVTILTFERYFYKDKKLFHINFGNGQPILKKIFKTIYPQLKE